MQPLLSVVMLAQNNEAFVAQALESVVWQNYPFIELIFIDNHSKDGTWRVAQSALAQEDIKQRFARLKCIDLRDPLPEFDAWKEGVHYATGVYITLIQARDQIEPNRLNEICAALLKQKKNWGFSQILCIDRQGDPSQDPWTKTVAKKQSAVKGVRCLSLAAMHQDLSVVPGNLFFSKKFWIRLHGFAALSYVYDWDFFLRAVLLEEPVYLENTKYLYRLTEKEKKEKKREAADEGELAASRFYNALQRIKVKNPVILSHANFVEEHQRQANKAGLTQLWRNARSFTVRRRLWRQWLKDRMN